MEPIFNGASASTSQSSGGSVTGAQSSSAPSETTKKSEPAEKPAAPKVVRKMGNLFSPSIKDALAGNNGNQKGENKEQVSVSNNNEEYFEAFTPEQFAAKWNEYLETIADRPNLRSTLSTVPEISNETQLILKIGNSVQEEEIRLVKPELVSWLRRELRNSNIELITRMEKMEPDETRLTEQQKMQKLIQKNPNLIELSKKFDLGFTD